MLDLVDDDGFQLTDVDGFAVDETCQGVCCGAGCASWRRLSACPTGPLACEDNPTPEPPDDIWVCTTVICIGTGLPLAPGDVVFYGGLCWTVTADPPVPLPPPGAGRVKGVTALRCVGSCEDDPCPTGIWYYLTRPCSASIPAVWICGVTRCQIRGCHVIDPAGERRRGHQLPPGAIIRRLEDMGPELTSCCDYPGQGPPDATCDSTCVRAPLFEFDPNVPGAPPCWPGYSLTMRCCCTRQPGDQFPQGRVRVVRWRTYQEVTHPIPSLSGTYELTVIGESIDVDGCATYTIRWRKTGFESPPQELVFENFSAGCVGCGNLGPQAPRLNFFITGGVFAGGCQDDPDNNVTVLRWIYQASCDAWTNDAEYLWDDGSGVVIRTIFEFTSVVVGRGPCGGGCGNTPDVPAGGDAGDAPNAPPTSGIAMLYDGFV